MKFLLQSPLCNFARNTEEFSLEPFCFVKVQTGGRESISHLTKAQPCETLFWQKISRQFDFKYRKHTFPWMTQQQYSKSLCALWLSSAFLKLFSTHTMPCLFTVVLLSPFELMAQLYHASPTCFRSAYI